MSWRKIRTIRFWSGCEEDAISATQKTSARYRRIRRFNVLALGDSKKLVTRGEPVKYCLPMEDIFGSSHIAAVRHGGRDRLKVETSRKYDNTTTDMINVFLFLCETCRKKKSLERKDSFRNQFYTLSLIVDSTRRGRRIQIWTSQAGPVTPISSLSLMI